MKGGEHMGKRKAKAVKKKGGKKKGGAGGTG